MSIMLEGVEETESARSGAQRVAARTVSAEQVRVRAYQIYEARRRSGAPGDAASDWAQAERELLRTARPSHGGVGPPARTRDVLAHHERERGETLLRSGD